MSQIDTNNFKKEIMAQYKPLDADTERELIIKAQRGCSISKQRLVCAQYPQILKIAGWYLKTNTRNELQDLFNEGVIGYYNSIDPFDVSLGNRHITMAVNFIRNAIRDYSQDNDLVRNSRQKSKSRENDPIHMANLEYDAELMGMTVTEYIAFQNAKGYKISTRNKAEKFGTVSFDAPLGGGKDDSEATLLDILADADAQTDSGTVTSDIKRMISILNKDELELVDQFFGMNCDKMTLDEIGQINGGISRQAVSNRLGKCLEKMRTHHKCNK